MISGKNIVLIATLVVVLIIAYDVSTNKTARSPSKELAIKQDQSTWITYTAPNNLFEVSLPAVPQHVSEAGLLASAPRNADVKYDVFLSQGRDGTAFMISTITYPTPFAEDQKQSVLESVVQEVLSSNPQNKVLNKASKTVQAFPSLEFTVSNSDGYMSKSIAILAHDVLFVLTVMEKHSYHLDEDFQTFVNSLKITRKNESNSRSQAR